MTAAPHIHRSALVRLRSGIARYGIVVALLALVIVAQAQSDTFLTESNLFNIGEQWAPVGVMAVGMTFVLIGGGFDLSVGATYAFSATLAASVVQHDSTLVAVVLVLGLGAAVGVANGLLVTRIGINALIATLGMAQIVRGLGLVYSDGGTYSTSNGFFDWLGTGDVGEVPVPLLVLVVLAVVLGVVLARTSFGRNVYAVGGNSGASYLAGVPVARVRILTYVISGMCAALAGMMFLGRVGSAQASAGAGIELQVIAAVLIGGVSIAGGEGAMWRAAVGLSILAVLQNFFNRANVNSFWQSVVQGAIILLAVGLDSYAKQPHRGLAFLRRLRPRRGEMPEAPTLVSAERPTPAPGISRDAARVPAASASRDR
jgi:ribose/xylose/arabinose/galactoside ABC-type transport system permease subunit